MTSFVVDYTNEYQDDFTWIKVGVVKYSGGRGREAVAIARHHI